MGSPMGGMKSSGIGRRNGEYGMLRYTTIRTIGVAKSWFKLPTRGKQYRRMAPIMRVLSKFLKNFG
jgi:hypothetical protein